MPGSVVLVGEQEGESSKRGVSIIIIIIIYFIRNNKEAYFVVSHVPLPVAAL
jgi:hypothetical protein